MQNAIFSIENPKAIKAREYGWLNAIHYMAPAKTGGVGNLCGADTFGCRNLCLGRYSGQASMVIGEAENNVRKSRRIKAERFMRDRANYMADVVRSIELAIVKARKLKLKLCVRMNGSTDIQWEAIKCRRRGLEWRNLFDAFAGEIDAWVDYTKHAKRFAKPLPRGYHLTFSRSEENEGEAIALLEAGVNVAVVFDRYLPVHWNGYTVIDGDKHDLRHLDPRGRHGYVVGLLPKGAKAKRDMSGFVVRQ